MNAASLLAGLLTLAAEIPPPPPGVVDAEDFEAPALQALITEPRLRELSGLAASRRQPGVLFAHNDSGFPNEIFALSKDDGRLLASWRILGARNVDWEDMAIFELDGKSYLLIADFGDNAGRRDAVELYVVEEPEVPTEYTAGTLALAWTIRYRYPDGPQDAEAVAVDVARGELLVLNKRRVPATLYRLPLRPEATTEPVLAEALGQTRALPQPSRAEIEQDPSYGRYRSQPTSMDLSPDGRELAVLTYGHAWIYRRQAQQCWSEVIASTPERLGLPLLPQAEAIAFSGDGQRLWITSERLPAPVLRIDRRAPARHEAGD